MEHQDLFKKHSDFVWDSPSCCVAPIARPQYRWVMIPLTVLRRPDCVPEGSKAEVINAYKAQLPTGKSPENIEKAIQHRFKPSFFNTSRFPLKTWPDDPKQIVPNLFNYLDGFSPRARKILDEFNFRQEIKTKRCWPKAPSASRHPDADICRDAKGNPEPDADLRDSENVAARRYPVSAP